jgi:hypothetical protein
MSRIRLILLLDSLDAVSALEAKTTEKTLDTSIDFLTKFVRE